MSGVEMEEELKILKRFKLDADQSVLIQKYGCFYNGQGIPVPGTIYIFNDCVCFSSFFNQKTLFGKKTKVKVLISEIILCETLNNFGTGVLLTCQDGKTYQFNNLGDDARMVNYLIQDMMEGYRYKLRQKNEVQDLYFQQLEHEMEKSAVRNSMRHSDPNRLQEIESEQMYEDDKFEELKNGFGQEEVIHDVIQEEEQLSIPEDRYTVQIFEDKNYIEIEPNLKSLLSRQWKNSIYQKTYQNMTASSLVNAIFVHRNQDDKSFVEFLSEHMQQNDKQIKSITTRIDSFTSGNDSLDDILIHSNYALNAFYNGQIGIDITRGTKMRQIFVKTQLHKAIAMIKVFPYVENQTFYVVSPRKIVMHSKLQMQKVFYSDQYYIDILWDFDEQLVNGQPQTTLKMSCDLVFIKKIALVQKKIQDYYDENVVSSFNKYLKPQLEKWIEEEAIKKIPKSPQKVQQRHQDLQYINLDSNNFEDVQIKNQVPKEKIAPEQLINDFLQELRTQTNGHLSEEKLNSIIMTQLMRTKESILTQMIEEGVDLDLNSKNLNPDSNNIDNCLIF